MKILNGRGEIIHEKVSTSRCEVDIIPLKVRSLGGGCLNRRHVRPHLGLLVQPSVQYADASVCVSVRTGGRNIAEIDVGGWYLLV